MSIPIAQNGQRSAFINSNAHAGPQCTFTLCRDVVVPHVHPGDPANSSNEQGILSIHFAAKAELNLQDLQLDKLRFYLGEDNYTSTQLYFWINHYFERAELVVNGITIPMPDFDFNPVGFERDDALLPYPKTPIWVTGSCKNIFASPKAFLFLMSMVWSIFRRT